MDAEVWAQLVAAADRAVEDYDSGAEPYRSVGEAVIDALQLKLTGFANGLRFRDSVAWTQSDLPAWTPVFRLGVLSLTEADRG